MNEHGSYMAAFTEVFSGLDGWGPGSTEATLRALSLVPFAPDTILEIGCGNGVATRLLPPRSDATVGDWLLLDRVQHRASRVLSLTSLVKRRAPGTDRQMQLIAANIDMAFVVTSCNQDFNIARLERYVALALEALAARCRFSDCQHETEPGCAVQEAIEEDRLDAGRLARSRKLQAEDAFNSASLAERRKKSRQFGKKVRRVILNSSNKHSTCRRCLTRRSSATCTWL